MNKEKLNDVLKSKTWNEIKTKDSWQLFKIMSEFVNGFEKMSKIGPCVTIFGSARTKSNNHYYKLATKIGKVLSKNGYGVITGGGPGIMEAGNKGAKIGGSSSVGLNIDLPFEASSNKYIDNDKNINHEFHFSSNSATFSGCAFETSFSSNGSTFRLINSQDQPLLNRTSFQAPEITAHEVWCSKKKSRLGSATFLKAGTTLMPSKGAIPSPLNVEGYFIPAKSRHVGKISTMCV